MLFKRFILLPFIFVTLISSALAESNNLNTDEILSLEELKEDSQSSSLGFDPNLTCRDFFHEIDPNAPDFFQYEKCRTTDYGQTWPIEVIYKVEGKYAKQAHEYLIKTMGMGDLKFVCCYWEQLKPVVIVNPKDNVSYEATFISEETLKKDWEKTTFYLVITGYRKES